MIRSVEVTNSQNETLLLDLFKPNDSGIMIVNVDGLGPVEGTINTTEIVTFDGAVYNSARANSRNITMDLVLLPKPTIEDARHMIYRYFPLKGKVTIKVTTDSRICETEGYVETNEPTIFSSQETVSISIICPNAWFTDASEGGTQVIDFYSIEPLFEFPFSNESLGEKLIVFGNIQNSFQKSIIYDGEVNTGFEMIVHAMGDIDDFTVYNVNTRENMTVYADKLESLTGSKLKAGDDLIISTMAGSKSIRLLRDGAYTNVLNCLGRDATWLQVSQGENIFAYTSETEQSNIHFTMRIPKLYQGV